MKLKLFGMIFIAVLAVTMSAFAVFDLDNAERRLCEAGVYDMLSDELIEMYEREIAGEQIVSNKTATQLERTAGRLGIDAKKLKAIMLLQDLASKVSNDVSLSELAAMSDIKLLGFFKQNGEAYLDTLSEERRQELKQMLSDTLKLPIKF